MRNILIIARRDLRAHFNSPVAYVVLGGTHAPARVPLLPRAAHGVAASSVGGFWEVDRATMDQMFAYLPLLHEPLRHPAR